MLGLEGEEWKTEGVEREVAAEEMGHVVMVIDGK